MPPTPQTAPPLWIPLCLWTAGIYNLLWGALVILFPNLLFDLLQMPPINYPQIWQCVGMIVGVYGVAYILAAKNPRQQWPITLVGLLGKIFGPLGFALALFRGTLPLKFGVTLLFNDLTWWIPFALILLDAYRHRHHESSK